MHKKRHFGILLLNILIFILPLFFYYTDVLSLTIKNATPLLILPILTSFSLFHSPVVSAFTGMACGIFMDACTLGSYCFNAILLLIIGAFVSVASGNLFNKNIRSAVVLSLITSVFYFVLLWLVFHTGHVNITDNFIYLLKYAMPSALYSAVFILPFYYLFRFLSRRISE